MRSESLVYLLIFVTFALKLPTKDEESISYINCCYHYDWLLASL